MVQILICDDDPAFVRRLSGKVADLARGFGEEAELRVLAPEALIPESLPAPDIVFLDIDLGRTSGIDLARRMRRAGVDALLIFVTNYPEYAPEGYEVSAFRFLDKSRLDQKLPYYFSQALQALKRKRDPIRLLCGKEEVRFPAACLVYAETCQRRLLLHMTGFPQPLLPCYRKMAELEALLAPRGFLRIHQSFLANMGFIKKIQSTGVWLTTGETLPLSARNYRALKETFLTWRAKNPWSIS